MKREPPPSPLPPPLAGKVAVVTGASRGIGRAVAEALHAAGAHVVRLARSLRDSDAGRRTRAGSGRGRRRTTAAGGGGTAAGTSDLTCDVTDPAQVARAAARVLQDHGAPDVLVNSAGGFLLKPIAATSPEDFTGQLRANLTGPFLVLRAFLPAMLARGSGHVVTIGSVADHRAYPENAAYAASKYGVRGLHEVLCEEIAGTGLRATLVSPGPVDTTLWDPIDPDARGEGFTPRAAMLRAEDVADAVRFVVTRPPHVAIPFLAIEPAR